MITLRVRRPRSRRSMESHPKTTPPVTNPLESFFDVLNRDQRTIVTIDRKCRSDSSPREDVPHLDRFQPYEISNSSVSGFIKKYNRPRTRFPDLSRLISRLGEVFIVGVCLLTIVRIPSVSSAPSTRHAKTIEQIHSHKLTEGTMSYLNPCGKTKEEEINNSHYSGASKASDPDILRHIIIRTKNALSYAESFRENYVEKTFHVRFQKHHDQWASQRYDWLPNESNDIPKRLEENVDPIHLQSKTFDEFLINIYEYLQKFAVGLEQIVIDQKKMQGEFRENFRMLEVHLRNVLCEIHEAMMERNLTLRKNVSREIMKDDIRHLEQASFRNVRDWFIFRDLMNGLEYVIQVFTYIEENLPQSLEPLAS